MEELNKEFNEKGGAIVGLVSDGKLVGDPIMGANPARYVEKMEEYPEKAD